MISFKKPETKPTALDDAIDNLVSELAGLDAGTEELTAQTEAIKKLCEAKATLQNADQPDFVKADTIVTVAGSLLGIISILGYEHVNVVTSKALSFVIKPKF